MTVKRSHRSTLVALRTGAGTRVVAVAWLLAVFDSGSLPTTVAVFVISPVTVGRTTSVIVTVEPAGTVPRLQVISAPPVHVPCVVDTETKVVPAGSGSASVTCVAASGPWLPTTIV